MKRFTVDFKTGVPTESFDSLEEAKVYAEENLAYTGEDILILKDGVAVECLKWSNGVPSATEEVTEAFGSEGFYGSWVKAN